MGFGWHDIWWLPQIAIYSRLTVMEGKKVEMIVHLGHFHDDLKYF